MFKIAKDFDLVGKTRKTISELQDVEDQLCKRFFGLEKPIHCMVLGAASFEPVIFVGPPGTAKSRLIRAFCELAGVARYDGNTVRENYYFEYLLTQFTEPSELFGYLNLQSIADATRKIERDDKGMMQFADVVFLDEVFNASSAILNSLLTFMNERRYHDRGRVIEVAMKLLFAATNQVPQSAELAAMFDRFLLRCEVENTPGDDADIRQLVGSGWADTYGNPFSASDIHADLLAKLATITDTIRDGVRTGKIEVNPASSEFARLTQVVADARRIDKLNMSNRRIVKFTHLILIESLLRAVRAGDKTVKVTPKDMTVLVDFGLRPGRPDQQDRLRQHLEMSA